MIKIFKLWIKVLCFFWYNYLFVFLVVSCHICGNLKTFAYLNYNTCLSLCVTQNTWPTKLNCSDITQLPTISTYGLQPVQSSKRWHHSTSKNSLHLIDKHISIWRSQQEIFSVFLKNNRKSSTTGKIHPKTFTKCLIGYGKKKQTIATILKIKKNVSPLEKADQNWYLLLLPVLLKLCWQEKRLYWDH